MDQKRGLMAEGILDCFHRGHHLVSFVCFSILPFFSVPFSLYIGKGDESSSKVKERRPRVLPPRKGSQPGQTRGTGVVLSRIFGVTRMKLVTGRRRGRN